MTETKTRYLITGGAGFIGSALVRHLLTSKHQVTIVDKLTIPGQETTLLDCQNDPHFTFFHGDICDSELIKKVIEKVEPEGIFHLAAESHVDRSLDSASEFVRTNIVGTQRLLDAALAYYSSLDAVKRDKFKFLHVSTDEVFGSAAPSEKFNESTAYAPRSPYAASKAASDHLVRSYYHSFDFPIIVTNCSNNYGPFQLPEKLIPLMILNAIDGNMLPVYGDGSNIRDWLHVHDHVRALEMIMQHSDAGQTFVIGGDHECSNLEIVSTICKILDEDYQPLRSQIARCDLIKFVRDRPGHDLRYSTDFSLLKQSIGWVPRIDFETGLRQTIEWYLGHEQWWTPFKDLSKNRRGLGTIPNM